MNRNIVLSEICNELGLKYIGDDVTINGLNLCNRVSQYKAIISYVMSDDYVNVVEGNLSIRVLVLKEDDYHAYFDVIENRKIAIIFSENPEKVFYDLHDYLCENTDFYDDYLWKNKIGTECDIHPSAIIEKGVIIGNGVKIGANTVIRKGSIIKNGCTIGCNSTIGSEGFQILRINGKNRKIKHCGGVILEENVYVGDNTAVCNSLFEGATFVGKNAMIDNLVHIAHNVYVGEGAVITAGTILCGSSIVEDDAWIGVNTSVLNKVNIGCNSKIGIGSVVTRDVPQNSLAYGVPAKVKNG